MFLILYIVHDHIDASFVFVLAKDFYITHNHIGPFYLFRSSKKFWYLSRAFFGSFFFVFVDNILLTLLYKEKNYKKQYIIELPTTFHSKLSRCLFKKSFLYFFLKKAALENFPYISKNRAQKNFHTSENGIFLHFLKRKLFLHFRKWKSPKNFHLFQETKISSVSGNRSFRNFLYLWKRIFFFCNYNKTLLIL